MNIQLSEEFLRERGMGMTRLIEQDITDNWPRYQRIKQIRSIIDGSISSEMKLPWAGASAINIPLIREKELTMTPQLMSAFWGVDPVITVQRQGEEFYRQQTAEVQDFMNFAYMKDIPDLYETTETWLSEMVDCGLATLKPYWNKRYRRISEMHVVKLMYVAGDVDAAEQPVEQPREKTAMEMLVDVFGFFNPTGNTEDEVRGLVDANQLMDMTDAEVEGQEQPEPTEPYSEPQDEISALMDEMDEPIPVGEDVIGQRWDVFFIEDREKNWGEVEFLESTKIDEIRLRVSRDIIDQDNPRVDLLEIEDCILPFRAKNAQDAQRVSQRFWLSMEEIEDRVSSGKWNITDEEMKAIKAHSTKVTWHDQYNPGLQEQKDDRAGQRASETQERRIDRPKGYKPYNGNLVMCFEVYTRDDIGYGRREEVIYTIVYGIKKIVQARHLHEEFPHGRRPFITAKYKPMANRNHAEGMGDHLAALNLEINTLVNLINNNESLVNNPWFLYEPTSFTAGLLDGVSPGSGIPCNDPKGVVFPRFQATPLADMSMVTTLLMFADRVSVTPFMGGSTQMKNAPRTARGTFTMLNEGHLRTDMLVTRLQRTAWMELAEQLFGLYRDFCPDEKWYYVLRKEERIPKRMTKEQLRGRYEFSFTGNTINTNREALRNQAQIRFASLIVLPDYQMDPEARNALIEDFLNHWGDGADKRRLLPALPGHGSFDHPPFVQENENHVLEQGIPLMALPTDDHADHLRKMATFERSQAFELMDVSAVGVWAAHKRQHQVFLEQQMRQNMLSGGGAAPGGGGANNLPTGDTMANSGEGTGLSTLQGGVS